MKTIGWDSKSYIIDGKPDFLVSGEFHYFRVPKADWRKRLELFHDAGGNCVATYIPWILHEPEEGDIRFGDTPERDLEGFLKLCGELGIFVVCRPGPYQYSEMKYDGLPGWLCVNYPQILARNVKDEIFRSCSVSYLHPLFLEKTKTWFKTVCPIIAKYTLSKGGPVAFVQFDNEMSGVHEWFSGGWDYNREGMGIGLVDGRYPSFLKSRFNDISKLNDAYLTSFKAFKDVEPYSGKQPETVNDRRRVKDYQDFYFSSLADYAEILTGWIREAGIDTDIVHNAANPNSNSYFRETVERMGKGFLLGSDHYYNLDMDWEQNSPSPKYANKVFYSTEMLRFMGFPQTVFELPSGSCSDWPPITPEDLSCCYMTNAAFGMKGVNYYVFTGGPNPENIGSSGNIYDYGAPISAIGNINPIYHTMSKFNHFLRNNLWMACAERVSDINVGLDWEYSRSHMYFSNRSGLEFSNENAWLLMRKGLLMTSMSASFSPNMADLYCEDFTRDTGKPLLVASSVCMAEMVQKNLIQFVNNGGKLLLAPVIPYLDENFNSCTLLKEFLGGAEIEASLQSFPSLNVGDVQNVLINGSLWVSSKPPAGAVTVAAEERSGREAGWKKNFEGGGRVIWLGLNWKHARNEHAAMLRYLMSELGLINRAVECDNPNIWTSLRRNERRGMLYLINLFSSPFKTNVKVRKDDGSLIDTGEHKLAPMEVKTIEIGF